MDLPSRYQNRLFENGCTMQRTSAREKEHMCYQMIGDSAQRCARPQLSRRRRYPNSVVGKLRPDRDCVRARRQNDMGGYRFQASPNSQWRGEASIHSVARSEIVFGAGDLQWKDSTLALQGARRC